jgi:hypothetical protein
VSDLFHLNFATIYGGHLSLGNQLNRDVSLASGFKHLSFKILISFTLVFTFSPFGQLEKD